MTDFFSYEQTLLGSRALPIVGIDEAGRGPLAGPVVAAAVCYREPDFAVPEEDFKRFSFIRDSKKLSPKKRAEVYELIRERFFCGVGIASPETIDRMNILQATFLAMKAALSDLEQALRAAGRSRECHLLVDGSLELPNHTGPQTAVVGGDGSVRTIAAASIIAKVTRDRLFEDFEREFPGYGFAKHKGYGTKEHMDALRRLGPCAIHRRSFKPVELSIPENANRRFAIALHPRRAT